MISDIKINVNSQGGNANLLCPKCGAVHLHHNVVTVFDRGEDEEITMVTTVDRNVSTISNSPSSLSENPSIRRDGVSLSFWCEQCGDGTSFILNIAQHKGSTEIFWEYE